MFSRTKDKQGQTRKPRREQTVSAEAGLACRHTREDTETVPLYKAKRWTTNACGSRAGWWKGVTHQVRYVGSKLKYG
jgi:hypothetical protein